MPSTGLNAWRGRRVFVTGHTGFKGGWLTLWLQHLGAQVCGYALDPAAAPNLCQAVHAGDGISDIRRDIRDQEALTAAMTEFAPEVVFHLAAQALVLESYADPVTTYETNVLGTVRVLEAVRRTASVRAVVVVTSDKSYENREWPWSYRENDTLGGRDPYASSKACAELVCNAYRQSYFSGVGFGTVSDPGRHVGLATARAGNVIGGGDWAAFRLLPDLVRGFLASRPAVIRQPHAVRPWQHVLEPLYGYLLLAERLLSDEREVIASAFNFGPADQDAVRVDTLADHACNLWGSGAAWYPEPGHTLHESTYLKLDCSLARAQLGWKPLLNLELALGRTLDWYKAHAEGRQMRSFTLAQIAAYEALLDARQPVPAGSPPGSERIR